MSVLTHQLNLPLRQWGKAPSTPLLSLTRASSSLEAQRMSWAAFFSFAFLTCSFAFFASTAFFLVAAISSGVQWLYAPSRAWVSPSFQVRAEVLFDFLRLIFLGVMTWVSKGWSESFNVRRCCSVICTKSHLPLAPFPFWLVGQTLSSLEGLFTVIHYIDVNNHEPSNSAFPRV